MEHKRKDQLISGGFTQEEINDKRENMQWDNGTISRRTTSPISHK